MYIVKLDLIRLIKTETGNSQLIQVFLLFCILSAYKVSFNRRTSNSGFEIVYMNILEAYLIGKSHDIFEEE